MDHTHVDWIGHCTPSAQFLNKETACTAATLSNRIRTDPTTPPVHSGYRVVMYSTKGNLDFSLTRSARNFCQFRRLRPIGPARPRRRLIQIPAEMRTLPFRSDASRRGEISPRTLPSAGPTDLTSQRRVKASRRQRIFTDTVSQGILENFTSTVSLVRGNAP